MLLAVVAEGRPLLRTEKYHPELPRDEMAEFQIVRGKKATIVPEEQTTMITTTGPTTVNVMPGMDMER